MVALSLCLGACGDGDDPGDATPTTTEPATSTSTTTTAPEPTDEEAVTQLVEEWWQVSKEILGAERPIDDASEFLTGPYLDRYRTEAATYLEDFRLERSADSELNIESLEIRGDEAELEMCVVDADSKVDGSTGELVDDAVVVVRYRDLIARSGSEWRIEERRRLGEVEGAVECPAA